MGVVSTERADDVAVIRLERPPVHAMDTTLLAELSLALEAFNQSDARAAVLTASGRAFCAGVDLRAVLNGGTGYLREFLPALSDTFATLFTSTKPIVAAVNGHAIAGGCILAAACDLRIMAAGEHRIGVTELLVGVPFPSWALEIMRFATPPSQLQTIMLNGDTYLPEEALRRGLLDEVVPPGRLMDRALEAARRLGRVPGPSFAHTKRQLRQPTVDRVQRHGPDFDALAEALWGSAEIAEAMRAYLERRVGAAARREAQ